MVVATLLTALLLLAHSSSILKSRAHTQGVAPAMAPAHLQTTHAQGRPLPGFASHEDGGKPQPWVEQGVMAMAFRIDDSLAAAAPAEDAVYDMATLNESGPNSSQVNGVTDTAGAVQDQSAAGCPAATALKANPEEEPTASIAWSQSETVGMASRQCGGSMQEDAVSSLSTAQSCVSCLTVSAEDSLHDAASAHITAPAAAATAVEPAPGDLADFTSTGHAVVVPDGPQLVCTPAAPSVSAPAVAVLGELAMGGFACPATAAAPLESDAGEGATDGTARAEYREDSSLLMPADSLHASRLDIQADTDALAAAADSTDEAASGPSQSYGAAAAEHKVQECSSAVAASVHSELAIAVVEPFAVLPRQEDQADATKIKAQTAVDHAQAVTSDAVRLPSAKAVTTETGFNSLIRAGLQPGTIMALAAESQLVLEQDQQDKSQDLTSEWDPYRHPQTTSYTEAKIDHDLVPNTGPIEQFLMTTSGNPYDGSIVDADAVIAADMGAVSAMPSQVHAIALHSDQSHDTAELQDGYIHDSHLATVMMAAAKAAAKAAAGAAARDATVQPASSPQVAVLERDEGPNADLAAELAAMMTLADSSSALIAQHSDMFTATTQSSNFEHYEGGAAATSCTDALGPIVAEAVETVTTATATDMSMPACNVGHGAASVCTAALPQQDYEVPKPGERDTDTDGLPAAAAAGREEARVTGFVKQPALDASPWHALIMEASWHHMLQLQHMLADEGAAFLITSPESDCIGLILAPSRLSSFLLTNCHVGCCTDVGIVSEESCLMGNITTLSTESRL